MTATSPFQWWHALQSRKALVIVTTATACGTAIVATSLIPPVYEGQAQFYVVDSPGGSPASAGSNGSLVLPVSSEATMSSYLALMQSPAIRRRVVQQVPERDAKILAGYADVSLSRKTTILVRILDKDPQVAASLANAYPVALDRFLSDLERERRKTNLEAVQTEQATALGLVDDARSKLAQFLSARGTSSVQREQDIELNRAQQLQVDLSTQQARLASLDQRYAVTTSQMRDEVLTPARQLQTLHPVLNRLAKELTDLEVDLAGARAEFDGEQGLRHPKVRMLQARVTEVRSQIDQEYSALGNGGAAPGDMLREQLRRDLLDVQRQRAMAISEIGSRTSELAKLRQGIKVDQTQRLEELRLTQQLDFARQQSTTIAQRVAELQTQELRKDRSVVVLGEAEPPPSPKYPSMFWNPLIASVLGLIAGIYLALISSISGRMRAQLPIEERTL